MNTMYLKLAACFAYMAAVSAAFGLATGDTLEKALFVVFAVVSVGLFLWGLISDPSES